MSNDNKTNLAGRHGANSSFSSIINMFAKAKQATKYQTIMTHIKNDVTGVVTHLFDFGDSEKQGFTSHANKRYYIDLSKLVSGRASRNLLAFFVPDNSSASQAVTIYSSIAPRAYLSALRGQTIISMANLLPTDYDGLTLQNKIAERRICGAVSNKTESKTRHPILLPYSVTLTQNLLGGHHFA
ncbi:hypothetical protein [Psychrobacter alimentarius]|uniref:hypothetical protein n=1 Tax=Psychrobacter alimentarius TaxID=261164 RepID=UPI003FD26365